MENKIEEIAKEFINDQYSFFTLQTRNKMILAFCEGYKQALSKAEDKEEEFETSYGEVLSTIRTPIEQPTTALDELERDIISNYDMDDALLVSYIIAKIQSLKQTPPTTALDELERWIEQMKTTQHLKNGCSVENVHIPSLLHYIQELKTTTPKP